VEEMIEKLLETFSKMYKRDGDNLILDDYKLGDGVYVLVNLNTGKVLTEFEVTKNDKCEDNKYYQNIVKYFNYSEIIGMNKAVDTKFKKIHSNQIYALKIKSNNLTKEIFEKSLNYYHKKLENYRDDLTKDKIKLKLYDELDDETKEVDIESLSKIKKWIEKNIYGYYEEKAKTINIYFVKTNLETEEEIEESYRDFERNMTKYLRPNVFVRTDCCIIDEESGKVLGVPNTWYTTNVDKPSLVNKGKTNPLPILLSAEEVILRDKLKLFLLKEMKKRNNFIYFNSFDIYATNKMIENKFYTNLIQIDRDSNGSVTFTRIEYLNNNEFSFEISDIVDFTKNEKMADDYFVGVADLEKTKELFNKNIFNNRLDGYFSGMKIERDSLKNFTMKYKDNFYNWFFLGNNQVGYIIERLLLERFRIALNNNKERKYKIKKIINLCFNLEQNLNMEDYKGDKMELKERLKTNLETKEDWKIQDDKEFAFNLGQLLYYLNTKVKGKDRNTFEFLRSYFQIDVKDLEMVVNKISRSFMNKCYETLSNKSKTVLASLMAYLEEKKFTELKYNLLLLGATTNCQLFANTEEEKNTDNEEENLNGTDDIDEDLEEAKKEKKEKKSKK
jgi:hypothetical protein